MLLEAGGGCRRPSMGRWRGQFPPPQGLSHARCVLLAQDRMAEAGGFARLAFTHPMLQHEMAIVLCPVTPAAASFLRPFSRRCHASASQTGLPGGLAPGAATTPVRPAEVRRQSDTSEKVAASLTSASELAS